ncbi:hypothetical protein AV530_006668 [Patagioenas fasciata monilis]|uniref:Uncharacterized protein n=1 Tax=Patagioenas fasciata monilis TaxID=372326 RepID=A0A1V4KRN1_PATFA|nr:hypothetical protein AV530_006668 [Patagioenas fasciata monilis]
MEPRAQTDAEKVEEEEQLWGCSRTHEVPECHASTRGSWNVFDGERGLKVPYGARMVLRIAASPGARGRRLCRHRGQVLT